MYSGALLLSVASLGLAHYAVPTSASTAMSTSCASSTMSAMSTATTTLSSMSAMSTATTMLSSMSTIKVVTSAAGNGTMTAPVLVKIVEKTHTPDSAMPTLPAETAMPDDGDMDHGSTGYGSMNLGNGTGIMPTKPPAPPVEGAANVRSIAYSLVVVVAGIVSAMAL